jgi:hypothetical protein
VKQVAVTMRSQPIFVARRSQDGRDLLPDYKLIDGLILDFEGEDLCGLIIEADSGWTCERRGQLTIVFYQGRERVTTKWDADISKSHASISQAAS